MIYKLILGSICFLYIYALTFISINLASGIFLCLCSFTLSIILKSYALFYTSLLGLFIIAFRYYNYKKMKMSSINLLKSFILNLTNILFSIYAAIQIMYFYSVKFDKQNCIPFTRITLVEFTPIAYIFVIYFVISLLVLSINNNLTHDIKSGMNDTIIKTAAAVISVAFLIIFINAILYFVVHNFPMGPLNAHFDGNFLKDAINSNFKLPKAFTDCLWFSATTFFTVGYGDMHPVGNIMYFLSIMEMISAYILGIIMVPILLFKISNK